MRTRRIVIVLVAAALTKAGIKCDVRSDWGYAC